MPRQPAAPPRPASRLPWPPSAPPALPGTQTPGAPCFPPQLVTQLAAEVPALRQPATPSPGPAPLPPGATWLWAGIFLLLTAGLTALMVSEPADMFLMRSTVVTTALVVAGTSASTRWFLSELRRLGLRHRFARPEPGRHRQPPKYERPRHRAAVRLNRRRRFLPAAAGVEADTAGDGILAPRSAASPS